MLAPGALGGAIPADDTFETNFISSGQRNIFRQTWQKRGDLSLIKNTKITERVNMKYSMDIFNVTNTPSFDIPVDDVTQNEFFNPFPTVGQPLYNSLSRFRMSAPSLSGLGQREQGDRKRERNSDVARLHVLIPT